MLVRVQSKEKVMRINKQQVLYQVLGGFIAENMGNLSSLQPLREIEVEFELLLSDGNNYSEIV